MRASQRLVAALPAWLRRAYLAVNPRHRLRLIVASAYATGFGDGFKLGETSGRAAGPAVWQRPAAPGAEVQRMEDAVVGYQVAVLQAISSGRCPNRIARRVQ